MCRRTGRPKGLLAVYATRPGDARELPSSRRETGDGDLGVPEKYLLPRVYGGSKIPASRKHAKGGDPDRRIEQ
jgi:hypothetical protein